MNEKEDLNLTTSGDRIKYIRKDMLNFSRTEFSKRHDFSSGTLQGWETNRYKNLSQKVIKKILKAFEMEGVFCAENWLASGKGTSPYRKSKPKTRDFSSIHDIPQEKIFDIYEEAQKNANRHRLNKDLIEACQTGNLIKVKELIQSDGANAHQLPPEELLFYNDEENSPIHYAVQKNHFEIVSFLINQDAQIDARNRKEETPLHWACYAADFEILKLLIEKGASINAVEQEGSTPFAWACYLGRDLKIIDFLYRNGADINLAEIGNNTPLYWACYKGHNTVVEFLLEKGADINKINANGESILDIAIKNGNIETIKLLISHIKQS